MKPTLEHMAKAQHYTISLALLQKIGQSGQYMGHAAGTSTDFLDHRPYVLGDDIRRLDWNAYARTDQLLLKRYQEEIRPSIHLWIDNSPSMGLTSEKGQLLYDLAAFLTLIFKKMDVQSSLILLGQGISSQEQIVYGDWSLQGRDPLQNSYLPHVQRIAFGGHVILLSDLLTPHDPNRLLQQVLQRANSINVLQILAKEDVQIEEQGAILLEDSETGEVVEVDLSAKMIQDYQKKLTELQNHWRFSLAGKGHLEIFTTEQSFDDICMQLVRSGILMPIG